MNEIGINYNRESHQKSSDGMREICAKTRQQ